MLCIEVPESLQGKILAMATLAEQTPEQLVLEMLEERLDHSSAYLETTYLRSSPRNRERLDHAIREIRRGCFDKRTLIDD